MKFSKIACVALLSASISTVALAVPSADVANLAREKESESVRTAAYNKILKAVNDLGSIYGELSKWSGEQGSSSTDINTKIYNALKVIKDEKSKITESGEIILNGKDASTLTIDNQGVIKLKIAGGDNTVVENGGQAITITLDDFAKTGNNHDKIAQIFADNNKDVWESFVTEFTKEHNKRKTARENTIDGAIENIISKPEQIDEKDDQYKAFVENKDYILDRIQNVMKEEQADVTKKQEALNKAIKEVKKDKLTLRSTDKKSIDKQETDIKALANKLTTAKGNNANNKDAVKEKADALIAAIDAGVKLQTKTAGGKELTKKDIDAIVNGTANKDDFGDGQTALDNEQNKATVLNALIGDPSNGNETGAQKAVVDATTEIGKVKTASDKVAEAQKDLAKTNEIMASANKAIAKATSDEG
uniref:hypothetical protein n=1 Tax=Campylobacter mucosalis TaxID=202 RepID=UPI0014706C33